MKVQLKKAPGSRDFASSTVIDAFARVDEPRRPNRSIGAILVDAGRLTTEDAERVLRHQKEHGTAFGDAAVQLEVATQDDVDYALSQQFDYPYLFRGASPVSQSIIAAYNPFSPKVEALRSLRTQLILRLFECEPKQDRLAIVSAEKGDGRSYLAANLAVVFSQLGERTLLIDADLRSPSQHALFGLENRSGLSSMLSGRAGPEVVQRIPSLLDLSLLPAGPRPPNPQELLGRPSFTQLLDEASAEFDIVIIDTPPGSRHSEAFTVASRAGAALMVTRRGATRVSGVRDMTQSMSRSKITIVGAVLNEF